MHDNIGLVLSILIICSLVAGIGFMVYHENVSQSELEQCHESCSYIDDSQELKCILDCNEKLAYCEVKQ